MIDRLRGGITKSLVARALASIALALVLWSWVTIQQDPETTRSFAAVPVSSATLADGLEFIPPVTEVNVTVTGPESDVRAIVPEQVSAQYDLSGITEPGTYTVPIIPSKPQGVWTSTAKPDRVALQIERVASMDFAVQVAVTQPPSGLLRIVDVQPEIDQVRTTGPESLVGKIAQVILPVDAEGQVRTFAGAFAPVAVDANGDSIAGVTLDPAAIFATVTLSERGKSVAVLPQVVGQPTAGFEVLNRTVNPATVIIDGPDEVLAGIVAVRTAPIDISDASESISATVGITGLPDGVTLIDPNDGQVQVYVEIGQRGVKQDLPGLTVSVINLGDGLSGSVEPATISAAIVAPESTLQELDVSTISVVVDAQGLGPGTYELTPTVLVPSNAQWISTTPATVSVTITKSSG